MLASAQKVPVAGQLTPYAGQSYGIVHQNYMIGGWRVADSFAALQTTDVSCLVDGMRGYVKGTSPGDGQEYEYVATANRWLPINRSEQLVVLDYLRANWKWHTFLWASDRIYRLAYALDLTLPVTVCLGGAYQFEHDDYSIYTETSLDGLSKTTVIQLSASVEPTVGLRVLAFKE